MPTIARALFPVVSFLVLAGCPGPVPVQVQSLATVVQWTLGGTDLTPLSISHHSLVALSAQGDAPAAKAGPEQCVDATAFLPGPPGDPRIYFLIGGAVHAWQAPLQQPARLEGNDAKLQVIRLLAFAKDAHPVEMLVSGKRVGESAEQLYKLTLGSGGIQAIAPVKLEVAGMKEFFARYSSPRCLDGGRRCLSPSHADLDAFIDVRDTPDGRKVTLKPLGKAKLADVAYAGADGKKVLVLTDCS